VLFAALTAYKVYELELEGGYWYVGTSTNYNNRLLQHESGAGALWTKLHKPIPNRPFRGSIVMSELEATVLESILTFAIMLEIGINRVRGAEFCQPDPFTMSDVNVLMHVISHRLCLRYVSVKATLEDQLQNPTKWTNPRVLEDLSVLPFVQGKIPKQNSFVTPDGRITREAWGLMHE
jgi:hypothetical protein